MAGTGEEPDNADVENVPRVLGIGVLPRRHHGRDQAARDEALINQTRHYDHTMMLLDRFDHTSRDFANNLDNWRAIARNEDRGAMQKRQLRDVIRDLLRDVALLRERGAALATECRRKEFDIQRLHRELYNSFDEPAREVGDHARVAQIQDLERRLRDANLAHEALNDQLTFDRNRHAEEVRQLRNEVRLLDSLLGNTVTAEDGSVEIV